MAVPSQTLMYFTLILGHCHENLWGFLEDQMNFNLLPKIFKELVLPLSEDSCSPEEAWTTDNSTQNF